MRGTFIVAMALGFLSSLPALACAQEASDPALEPCRAAFDRAQAAYDRELFTEAEDGFRESLNCMPPTAVRRAYIWMNIALSIERQGGRDAEALEAWETFRRDAESFADPEHLVRADGKIREIRARMDRRARSDGGSIHPIGPILLAVGGAALVAGVVVGGYGLAERGAVLDECSGTACPSGVESRAASLATYGAVADGLLWPGLAVAAVGVVLMLLVHQDGGQSDVAMGPNGFGVRW